MTESGGLEIPSFVNTEVLDDGFKKRADDLYAKFGLIDSIPNRAGVIDKAFSMLQEYQVPAGFCNNEVNLSLVLGCAEKLISPKISTYYKSRVENLFLRLIEPTVGPKIDSDNLWGKEPDLGGLEDDKLKEYVVAHRDARASADFEIAHSKKLERCKQIWRDRGYSLEVQVYIVSDSKNAFKEATSSGGYINPPERDQVERTKSGVLEIVLTKEDAEKMEFLVRHEIYHIEDYFGYKRRGFQSGILEGIDELHTEFAVGNFKEGKDDPESTKAAYFHLKDFWRKLSTVAGLEFDLLSDRDKLIRKVCSDFGFSGLVDFSLAYAHGSGKAKVFETFYGEAATPIINMLVDREKIRLRKSIARGVSIDSESSLKDISALEKSVRPEGKFYTTYKKFEVMIPDGQRKIYSNSPNDEVSFSRQIDDVVAGERIEAYAHGLAVLELFASGELTDNQLLTQTMNVITRVPLAWHMAEDRKSKFEQLITYKLENYKKPREEVLKDEAHSWLVGLSTGLGDVSFVFSLENSKIRDQLLSQINSEIDKIAKFVVDQDGGSGELIGEFVKGIYGYNLPFDLRDHAVSHLISAYPELAPKIIEARSKFDSRRHKTTSL